MLSIQHVVAVLTSDELQCLAQAAADGTLHTFMETGTRVFLSSEALREATKLRRAAEDNRYATALARQLAQSLTKDYTQATEWLNVDDKNLLAFGFERLSQTTPDEADRELFATVVELIAND